MRPEKRFAGSSWKPRVTVAPLEEVKRRRRRLARRERPAAPASETVPSAARSADCAAVAGKPAATPVIPDNHWRQVALPWALAGGFLLLALCSSVGWLLAAAEHSALLSRERRPVVPDPMLNPSSVTPEQEKSIELALADLRSGLAEHSLAKLRKTRDENPRIRSLDYLIGLAALQAGNPAEAEQAIVSSLAKGERVSDALALRSVLQAQVPAEAGAGPAGGDSPSDATLRAAIAADPANPFPYFEMATRLRSRGDHTGARGMLESARLRLQPVDAHTAVDVSLRLLELQEKPDAELPQMPSEADAPADLFGAAYLGFRLGLPEEANAFLRRAGGILPPDLFAYLVADPAFTPYQRHLRQGLANLVP